jgi:hypothetical protein
MTLRSLLPLAVLMTTIAVPAPAMAHRLDEYLQATRVSIGIDRVVLEIDLTPGASLAADAFARVDTNGDGTVSPSERTAYAQAVLDAVLLTADGRPTAVSLLESHFPDLEAMAAGTGTIRLQAAATIPATRSGRHILTYLNGYLPGTSVYLANALVPDDGRITIAAQRRDPAQRLLALDYDVAYGPWPRTLLLMGGFTIVGLLAAARRLGRGGV